MIIHNSIIQYHCFQAHVSSTTDTQTLTCSAARGRWWAGGEFSIHDTLPDDIKDEQLPLFKCDPVQCTHEPPDVPAEGCGIVLPIDIHDCIDKQYPVEQVEENKPAADNLIQYETTINYTCPSADVKQSEVDYLKNNFTFDFPEAITPSTYIHTLQAYCEIDK